MKIINYRSSVTYTLISYKEGGAVNAEIKYSIKKSDNKVIMSWIEFVEESVRIDGIHILKTPTPVLEKGVLTYDIAYDNHKYTVYAQYADTSLLKELDEFAFVEQLTADLFGKSLYALVTKKIHVPTLLQKEDGDIILSIKRQ